jgi:DNA-directed RNA polymerase specialized sigma24 family protein
MEDARNQPAASDPLLAAVLQAARRGASSVARDLALVSAATESALERFENALLSGKRVGDWVGWAFRVGANAAKKLATRRRAPAGRASPSAWLESRSEPGTEDHPEDRPDAESVRAAVAALQENRSGALTSWQAMVLQKLLVPGMTFHRAARELGKDRSNVKRSFRRALARVKKSR